MAAEAAQGPNEKAIEVARRLARRIGHEMSVQGFSEIDILSGLAFGLFDLAQGALGSAEAAAEWQRTAVDLCEGWDRENRYGR